MSDATQTDRATLTVEEAARLLGIGRGLAYEGARTGTIPSLRLGRRIVVPRAGLERLLASGRPPNPSGPRDERSLLTGS